jgi:hypothetical protein
MLVKLIRPLLENGWNTTKFISSQTLSTSSIFFQQSFSATNSDASSKTTGKAPNLKNQQQNTGNKNKNRAESDAEQGRLQQEGPADKEAEQKSSNNNDRSNK